jgi:imidazoleglycerol phosphate dehydratase HisB
MCKTKLNVLWYDFENRIMFFSGHESNAVGMKFFEGIVNNMYLNKVKAKLAAVSAHYEQSEQTDRHATLMALFKSLGVWLEDSVVRDANVHIASLAPIFMPKKLHDIIAGNSQVKINFSTAV